MGTSRFTDLQTRATEVLDLSSLTVDEFQPLVPPFEAAFQAHMAHWRLDGRPRTARRYTTYTNCALPTPEARQLFLLVDLKTYPLQVVQGRWFGMGQSKAHQWIHVLMVVLRATLRALVDAPKPARGRVGPAPGGGRGGSDHHGRAARAAPCSGGSAGAGTHLPPVGHAGTERRSGRPQDPTEPTRY